MRPANAETVLRLRHHARAVLVPTAAAAAFVLAAPGLDALQPGALSTRGEQAEARERWPAMVVEGATWLARFNDEVRIPLVLELAPLEVPFRIRQNWSLYTDGAPRTMRVEISVDGRLVSRSEDPAYPWLASQLRNRRIRPMVATFAEGGVWRRQADTDPPNTRGLARWVGQQAERDFPGCSEVVLAAMWGDWPGKQMSEHHRVVAKAPTWTP